MLVLEILGITGTMYQSGPGYPLCSQ